MLTVTCPSSCASRRPKPWKRQIPRQYRPVGTQLPAERGLAAGTKPRSRGERPWIDRRHQVGATYKAADPSTKTIEVDVQKTAGGSERWKHRLTRDQEGNCEGKEPHERRRTLNLSGQAAGPARSGSGTSREESRDA